MPWYWVDTGYACGALITNRLGVIKKTAPIFWKWRGKPITWVLAHRVKRWKKLRGE